MSDEHEVTWLCDSLRHEWGMLHVDCGGYSAWTSNRLAGEIGLLAAVLFMVGAMMTRAKEPLLQRLEFWP